MDCGASLWRGIFLNSAASVPKSLDIIHSGNFDSVKVQEKKKKEKKANSQRAVKAGVKHLLIESGHPSLPVTELALLFSGCCFGTKWQKEV